MPILGFESRFADAVESGRKCQTIRAWRKKPIKVGDRLYLYTGLRHAGCRKLGEGICIEIARVTIDYRFPDCRLDTFAQADGFADWPAMVKWFEKTHGLPFSGQLIRWRRVEADYGVGKMEDTNDE